MAERTRKSIAAALPTPAGAGRVHRPILPAVANDNRAPLRVRLARGLFVAAVLAAAAWTIVRVVG